MTSALTRPLIIAAAAAALGAAAAGWVQQQRLGAQIARLQQQHTAAQLQNAQETIAELASFQKGFDRALATFQRTQQQNAADAQALGRAVATLDRTARGLQHDFAGLDQRIAAAARPALAQYAATCTNVFQHLVASGHALAASGATIARAADGHAADAALMRGAWPQRAGLGLRLRAAPPAASAPHP